MAVVAAEEFVGIFSPGTLAVDSGTDTYKLGALPAAAAVDEAGLAAVVVVTLLLPPFAAARAACAAA